MTEGTIAPPSTPYDDTMLFSSLALGWALHLNEDVRNYYSMPGSTDANVLAVNIKQVRGALDMLERELHKQGILANKEGTA